MADSPKVPLTNKPGVTNWVERYGALKPHETNWIYRCAEHLKGKGMPEGIAIPTAKNAALKLCSTGDLNFPGIQQANLGSRAEACAALHTWEAAQAKAKAAKDLAALRQFRVIDLAASFVAYEAGERRSLPDGATTAYLDLAEARDDVIDLAFNPSEARDFHGQWSQMAGKLRDLAHGNQVLLSERQHDTIAAHAVAHGEPRSVVKGTGGNVVVGFANGQLHTFGSHGGGDRLDNLPASGGPKPPLSAPERQAIHAEEMRRAFKDMAPDGKPSADQLTAIKGVARQHAVRRIDMAQRSRLPLHTDRPAMSLSDVRRALALDLSQERS